MEPTYFDALAVLATLLGSLIVYYVTLKRSTAPLPPGPKKLPILGNLFNFPQTNPHIVYSSWSKQLGTVLICLFAV